jgi:hypothetical protein
MDRIEVKSEKRVEANRQLIESLKEYDRAKQQIGVGDLQHRVVSTRTTEAWHEVKRRFQVFLEWFHGEVEEWEKVLKVWQEMPH